MPEPPSPAGYAGKFAGAYDETIGPIVPATAGFSDANFTYLLLDDKPPTYTAGSSLRRRPICPTTSR